MTEPQGGYQVRPAAAADLADLTDIKPPLALHRDRLRDADDNGLLYLVVEQHGAIAGFGLLVFAWPATWPEAGELHRLPAMIDLCVAPACRGRGAGSQLIRWMESAARARGAARLYLGVDPVANPRAHRLYLRLGYRDLQARPYKSRWRFADSDGRVHEGDDWNLDMAKDLGA
jgi:GNAT superfamily N-acetyltransferase